jgi:drug/metabolite transporter (DMT)-like permease
MAGGGEQSAARRETGAYLILIAMVLIGSSTATSAKLASRELPIGLMPLVRFGLAGLCLLPMVWRDLGRIWREDRGRLLAASAFCVPINQTFFLNGNHLAPTSHTGLIYASCPLVVLLLVTALGQERLRPERLVGVLASVLGVIVIGLGNLGRPGTGGSQALWGDLLLIGAVTSWGAYLTVNKPLVGRHRPLPVLAATFLIGSVLHLPVAAVTMPHWGPALRAASWGAWASLIYMALVASLLGLACQNIALRRFDASQVAIVGNISPVLTVVWGILLLGEAMTPALALGGSLTLGGVLWSNRPMRARIRVKPVAAPPG